MKFSPCSPCLRASVRIILGIFFSIPFSLFSQDLTDDWDDELLFTDNEGITITGTQQTTQQISVIDREEIERRNSADLAALLQDTLDLNIVRYGAYGNQAGINLRGFDGKRVAFLIDGVPANSSLDGKFDIAQIDLNNVERIEVIYGGSDSKFNVSGALGGVVNIITVKKQNQGWAFGVSLSNTSALPGEYRDRGGNIQPAHWEDLLDTQNYALSAAYGGKFFSLSANAFANRAQNHFLFRDYADYIRRKDNNEMWDTGIGASLVWELPDFTKIISSSNFYYGDRNFPASGFSENTGSQQDITVRQILMLEAPRVLRDELSAELSLSWNYNRLDYTSPAILNSLHNQHNIGIITRLSWSAAEKLILRGGADLLFNLLDSTEIGSRIGQNYGFYLTAEWQLTKSFLAVPSLKAAFSGADSVLIPKLGLLWNITDSLTIKNNYFRSFKFPDFEELYWSGGDGVGNPDLLPEDGWGGDIGTAWRINKWVQLENTFFTQWLVNSIHWYYNNDGIWRPENVGEAIFFGLDNRLNITLPAFGPMKKNTLSLSYQYLRSYLLSFGYTFKSDKRIPYNPEHTVGASLDISWGSGSALISGHFESVRYNDRANLTSLKPYFLLNASVNQSIGNNVILFCTLRNILNYSYESFYDYPMPGVTFTLGMRILIEKFSHGAHRGTEDTEGNYD